MEKIDWVANYVDWYIEVIVWHLILLHTELRDHHPDSYLQLEEWKKHLVKSGINAEQRFLKRKQLLNQLKTRNMYAVLDYEDGDEDSIELSLEYDSLIQCRANSIKLFNYLDPLKYAPQPKNDDGVMI